MIHAIMSPNKKNGMFKVNEDELMESIKEKDLKTVISLLFQFMNYGVISCGELYKVNK